MGALSIIPDSLAGAMALEAERENARGNMDQLARSSSAEKANAVAALNRGTRAAGLERMRGSRTAASAQVMQAVNGLDTTQGTAADVRSDVFAELDAATAMNNARAEAMGHERAAEGFTMERDKLKRRWQDGGFLGGTADDEYAVKLATSALGAAVKFGMGG